MLAVITASHSLVAYLMVRFALLCRQVIDAATAAQTASFQTACLRIAGCVILICILNLIVVHFRETLLATLDRAWKRDLTHTLLTGEYKTVREYHTGEMINRMNNDVRIVNGGITSIIPGLASMLTSLIAAISVLATLDIRFTAIFFAVGIVMFVFTALIRKRLKGMHKAVSESAGAVSGFIQEMLEKLLMVQAMDVGEEMERREDELLEKRWKLMRKRKNIHMISSTGIQFVFYSAEAMAIIWCASRLLRGEITFGTLAAITQLVNQLKAPLVNMSGFLPQYVALSAGAERLKEIDDLKVELPEPEDGMALYESMRSIETRGLVFSYEENRSPIAFRDIAVPKGAFAAMIGPSGTGKSTFLKLLLGIYPPDHGEIFVNCLEGRIPLGRSTRKLFAYVPQGNLLISGTLRENILLTKPGATEEELQRALYISDLTTMISELPNGLDTQIGENALGISEGQAQRISIARAVLSGAPILLLDEATSALDEETERTVLERIRALEGVTSIAVTHRHAAMQIADVVIDIA